MGSEAIGLRSRFRTPSIPRTFRVVELVSKEFTDLRGDHR